MSNEQDIIITQDEYLMIGIIPRGCEDMLWRATLSDYDIDCIVGTGNTPLDAIVDLLDQIEYMEWIKFNI